jgi:hypothetical protein
MRADEVRSVFKRGFSPAPDPRRGPKSAGDIRSVHFTRTSTPALGRAHRQSTGAQSEREGPGAGPTATPILTVTGKTLPPYSMAFDPRRAAQPVCEQHGASEVRPAMLHPQRSGHAIPSHQLEQPLSEHGVVLLLAGEVNHRHCPDLDDVSIPSATLSSQLLAIAKGAVARAEVLDHHQVATDQHPCVVTRYRQIREPDPRFPRSPDDRLPRLE